jgi:TonB-dependent starch-binding outer membrane protein SusC
MRRTLVLTVSLILAIPGVLSAQEPAARYAAQPTDGSLLGVRAKLNVQNVAVGLALHELSRTSGVPLAFSSSLVPAGATISCACMDRSVGEALDEILLGTALSYAEVRRQIVIEPIVRPYAAPYRGVALASNTPYAPLTADEVRVLPRITGSRDAPAAELRTGTITGRVLSGSTAEPLASAQVVVVGTSHGAITGPDGRFRITNVAAGAWELRATLVGYRPVTQSVTVVSGGAATVEMRMTQQAVELDAVVVTGTAGAATRRELGNSVGIISNQQLELLSGSSISEVLQGQTTGLQFFANDGQVGTGNTIVLRGINSVTQGSEPLIYIDGVRVNNPAFAANTFTGVAAAGNPGAEGTQTSPKPMDALNPADIERVEVIRGAAATTLYGTEAAGGVIQIFTKRGAATGRATWTVEGTLGSRFQTANGLGPVVGQDSTYLGLKRFLETGGVRGLGLSVQGGSDFLRYFLSASHDYEEGVVANNNSGRTSIRGNFGFRPHQDLLVDVNTSFATRSSEFAETGDNTYGLLLNVFRGNLDNTGGNQEILFDIENNSTDDRFVGGLTLVHTPTASVVNRFTAGVDYTNAFNRQTIPFGFRILPRGRREINRWTNRILSLDYAGTWSTQFGESVSSAFSWGGQIFQNFDHAQFATGEGFGGPGDKTIRSGAVTRSDETQLTVVNAGAFLQEVIGYRNRMFLTGGFRVDGNSAFGEALGLQVYPKVSASWVISEEDFWPESLGLMRLRGAVGESGKAPGAFDAVRTWSPVPGYNGQPGVSPSTVGNPELGPERSREVELGFESAILDDRVSGEFTWFRTVTSDALFAVPAPPSMGFLSSPLQNVGKIENRGIEASVTVVPVASRSVRWDVGGKYSTARSEVLDMGGSAPFNVGFAFLGQWIREGYPVVAAFGARVTNPDEIADPIIEQDAYLGPIYPTHHYSLSSTLTLGGRVTVYVLGQGSGGNVAANNMARQGVNRGLWPECYDRMDRASQPAIWRARCITNSDLAVWTRSADFFRLRTVSLSWQLPENLVPGATSTSLLVSGQNLWRSQGYTGLDPELNRGGRFSVAPARYEYYQLPPPQGLTISVRSTF